MSSSNSPSAEFSDPRGRGFRSRVAVEEVWRLLDERVRVLGTELVSLADSAGRVLAADAVASLPMPPFDRAAMDGYAVVGEETFGAEVYTPALFQVIGRSRPGRRFAGTVGPGQAVEIATGAPMPAGADTVVPVESTQREGTLVRVVESLPPGRHVGLTGEDLAPGTIVLQAGRVLRPQDLGVLSAMGMGRVELVRRPHVCLLITGDELLPAGSATTGDQIADMNSVMIAALVKRDGGTIEIQGPLSDDRSMLRERLVSALRSADCVLISGGSSTGPEDHAPGLVAELAELPIHGVALRPASPTGLGFSGKVPVVLLPGNPVSCLCAYDLFAARAVRILGGRSSAWPYRSIQAALAEKLSSALGRMDYARVRLVDGRVEPLAIGGASILSSTTRADGFVLVSADREGYPAGEIVMVWLYDNA